MSGMKRFQRKEYGRWDVWYKTYTREQLEERRATLARAANTRLRGLEQKKSYITGERLIEQPQFGTIRHYLSQRGKRRFSESKNYYLNTYSLKHEIVELEMFLESKTSTVGGAREVEEKRVSAFVDAGVSEEVARSKEFYDFLNSKTFDELGGGVLTSDDLVELFDLAREGTIPVAEIMLEFENFRKNQDKGYLYVEKRIKARIAARKKAKRKGR